MSITAAQAQHQQLEAVTVPPAQPRTEQLGEYVARKVSASTIDLGVGQPAPHTLPLSMFQAAAQHRLTPSASTTCDPSLLLQYGPFRGYPSFRAALAQLLTKRYGCAVHKDDLMVTAGVSHGLDLACRHLSQPGDCVVVEAPTYFLASPIFTQNRLTQVACRADEDGLDTAHLEQLLASGQHRVSLLYCIPIHHNPRGTTLSHARRLHLVQLAHQYGFHVIADEVYQLLSFQEGVADGCSDQGGAAVPAQPEQQPRAASQPGATSSAPGPGSAPAPAAASHPGPPSPSPLSPHPMPLRWYEQQLLASQSQGSEGRPTPSRVVSLGSFSKIMAPGLRLGWVEAGAQVLQALTRDGAITSGGSLQLASGIAHSALELGLLEPHMDGVVRPHLAAACDALCGALAAELPCARFHRPKGGYFVWVDLGEGVDAQELLALADSLASQQGQGQAGQPQEQPQELQRQPPAGPGSSSTTRDEDSSGCCAVRFTPGVMCGGGEGARSCVRLCFAFYRPHELREGVRRLAALLRTYEMRKAGQA